jgi:hypothetical protein
VGGGPKKLVFVDECGLHTSLARVYGYAPRGERLGHSVPRKRGSNTTLISSTTLRGMGTLSGGGGGDHRRGLRGLRREGAGSELRAGQIVAMDNLGAHRPKRVRELIEGRGRELLYLPAYSPDHNPIEEAFAKAKGLLRQVAARSKGALVEAMGVALSAVSSQDARGSFEHAG